MRFAAVEAAHDWGLTPSQLWAASEEDQAYMIAYTQTIGRMQSYERMQANRPVRAPKPKARK